MRKLRAHLSYANVVSTLCLFILLGGIAYAANQLPKNSVGSPQLKKGAVATSDISKKAVVPRALAADRVPQLLVPNLEEGGKKKRLASGECGDDSAGSLIKLSVGESCTISKPPFTIGARCSDAGGGQTKVEVFGTASEDNWFGREAFHPANEEVSFGSWQSAGPQSILNTGPVLATPSGESLILGDISLGVNSLAPCWAALYGVG
jgi:hypothetical protein